MGWTLRVAGLRVTSVFLWATAFYYLLFAPRSRRASLEYLERVGEAATWRNAHRHFLCFATVSLHRLLFITGKHDVFSVTLHGHERVMGALKTGRGALLLGAHIGSFEAMRALASDYRVPLTVLVDFRHAQVLNGILRRMAREGDAQVRMLQIDDANGGAVLDARACIERGELVAILGDRVPAKGTRTATAQFLGSSALFPTGPYLLAHVLRCPVFLVAALFASPNRYDIYCEPFAESVNLPRGDRALGLARYAQSFADALTGFVRKYPYNWFNFYPFWSTE